MVSWCRFSVRKALKRRCSARVDSSCGSSALSSRVVPRTTKPSQPSTPTQLATATSSMGSLILLPRPRTPCIAPWKGEPARLRLRFGRRLTVIIGREVRGSGLRRAAQRESNREHQQRGDLVDGQQVEHPIRHLQLLDRIGQLNRDLETVRQDLVQPGNAGAAAGGEDSGDAARRPAGRLQERGGALDADRQLLAARLEKWIQRLARLDALEHLVGLLGGETALPLQIFLETAGTD